MTLSAHYLTGRIIAAWLILDLSACASSSERANKADIDDAASLERAIVSDPFADDAFKAAIGCDPCKVFYKTALHLPESRIQAASAKVSGFDADGYLVTYNVTLRSDRSIVTERELLAAEREAHLAKYGNLSPKLYAKKGLLAGDETLWVTSG